MENCMRSHWCGAVLTVVHSRHKSPPQDNRARFRAPSPPVDLGWSLTANQSASSAPASTTPSPETQAGAAREPALTAVDPPDTGKPARRCRARAPSRIHAPGGWDVGDTTGLGVERRVLAHLDRESLPDAARLDHLLGLVGGEDACPPDLDDHVVYSKAGVRRWSPRQDAHDDGAVNLPQRGACEAASAFGARDARVGDSDARSMLQNGLCGAGCSESCRYEDEKRRDSCVTDGHHERRR